MGVNKMLGLSLPRNAAILFLMSVGLSLSFLGCVQKNKTAPDVVTVQFSGEPATLDPTLAEDGLSLKILSNIMLGLYAYNDEGQLIPALSESVQISKDQKTYQFKIKSQALWSDGVPVKAEQFKLAIERALDPKSGSRLSGMISMIQKVEDHLDPQDQTLKITLKKPVGYFLSLLSLPITLPLRQDILDAHQGKIDFLLNPKLPTTGAYQIIEHQRDQKITLARNAWVTLTHPQSPREVILKIIQDESTASSLFLKGELDILGRVPDLEYERFIKEKKLKVFPMVGTFFLAFNLKKAPFNQVEVRRAVSVAIQREQVIRSFGIKSPTQTSKSSETPESHDALLKEKATLSWIPWSIEGYRETLEFSDLMKKSYQQVKEHPQNFKLDTLNGAQKVIASYDQSARNNLIMQKVQADLKQELKLSIELNTTDWKTFLKNLKTNPTALYRFGWLSAFLDPMASLQAFVSNDPYNFTGWSNARYDRLIEEIVALPLSSDQRKQKVKEAQNLILDEEAIVVPLYHYVTVHAVQARIHNFKVNPIGNTLFEYLTVQASTI